MSSSKERQKFMLGLFQAADSNGNTNIRVLHTAVDYIT